MSHISDMNVIESLAFSNWLAELRDVVGRRAIVRRLVKLQATGHFGDVAVIDTDLSEMRFHVGPGYRVYYTMRDGAIVLVGGTKRTQDRDIAKAREMVSQL